MHVKGMVAEFVGTFALVFVAAGAMAMDHASGGALGLVGIAVANGLIIAVMASATMAISGGQFNPAVSLALLITGHAKPGDAIAYIATQLIAGVAAVFVVGQAVPAESLQAVAMGTPSLGATTSTAQAVVTEIVLTFILVFVIFGTAVDRRAPKQSALYIGMAVTLAILMGGPISGAVMNPARYFGPALLGPGLGQLWIYTLGPLVGGASAALLYHHVLDER